MKYFLLSLFSLLVIIQASSQQVYYAAAKNGLSMREKADVNSKVLEKIPFGQAVELLRDTAEIKAIFTEGFSGSWWLVKYDNKVGYIVSAYLLNTPPPKPGVKRLEEFFSQISTANGNAVTIGKTANGDEAETQLKKQLYKNGMEWHVTQGYEYNAALYMIPGYTIEQAYLLLRLVNQFPEMIGDKDPYPTKNTSTKTGISEKVIEVERENYGDGKTGPIKKIKFIHTQGAITEMEIFMVDTQVLISYSSGV